MLALVFTYITCMFLSNSQGNVLLDSSGHAFLSDLALPIYKTALSPNLQMCTVSNSQGNVLLDSNGRAFLSDLGASKSLQIAEDKTLATKETTSTLYYS